MSCGETCTPLPVDVMIVCLCRYVQQSRHAEFDAADDAEPSDHEQHDASPLHAVCPAVTDLQPRASPAGNLLLVLRM